MSWRCRREFVIFAHSSPSTRAPEAQPPASYKGVNAVETFDAILILSFGGPEGPDDVMPFLENVLRGRNVPRERMLEVADNYALFGGRSPINDQCRQLISALQEYLAKHGPALPVYWGNRNWHPYLAQTMRQMKDDGIRRAAVFATSAYSSYSSCRQYREDLAKAQAVVGEGAPECVKLRPFYSHPGFLEPMLERLQLAFEQLPVERRREAHLLFSAHSIPVSMAQTSRYAQQLAEVAGFLGASIDRGDYRMVWQSRSGPPSQPWLEPDVKDALSEIAAAGGSRDVVLQPIGFVSDHMEVLVDLDHQAKQHAEHLGLNLIRAGTPAGHPKYVAMVADLVRERMEGRAPEGFCTVDCCPPPRHGPARPESGGTGERPPILAG